MNTEIIHQTVREVLAGEVVFPEVVRRLLAAGVEYYHVDYVRLSKSYYGADGNVVVTPIHYEGLPPVASDFDSAALRADLLDSQKNGQHYCDFTIRAMQAGVQSYTAFLRGKRVTYLGRQGDQHVEWFPGAGPAKSNP